MLVSHYRHLEEHEGEPFGPPLVLRGAGERLARCLMTALARGLALLPLVAGGNRPGQEIEYPLSVVILGGLVTSTRNAGPPLSHNGGTRLHDHPLRNSPIASFGAARY